MIDGWELYKVEDLKGYKEKKYVFRALEPNTLDGYPAWKIKERPALSEADAWRMLTEDET